MLKGDIKVQLLVRIVVPILADNVSFMPGLKQVDCELGG